LGTLGLGFGRRVVQRQAEANVVGEDQGRIDLRSRLVAKSSRPAFKRAPVQRLSGLWVPGDVTELDAPEHPGFIEREAVSDAMSTQGGG
jgi:hypothetical protein